MSFSNQHVVVTGGASGIGLAVCEQLLQANAKVSLIDLHGADLIYLHQKYQDRLRVYVCDVTDRHALAQTFHICRAQFGPVDKLVCAAGKLQMGTAAELTTEQWRQTFAVNTEGVWFSCQQVLDEMQQRRKGAIVVVSSNAATTPRASMSAYAASKAAVTQFARCLALEMAEFGVRVNIVSPGSTDTPMQRAMWTQGSSAQTVINGSLEQYRLGIPLRKIASPLEIAQGVVFLLSDQASHITLHDLRIDGGATLDY